MLEPRTIQGIVRAERRYAKKAPTRTELHRLSVAYRDAVKRYYVAHDQVKAVRGLDEFDPKHVAWENRVYRAHQRVELTRGVLLAAAVRVGGK